MCDTDVLEFIQSNAAAIEASLKYGPAAVYTAITSLVCVLYPTFDVSVRLSRLHSSGTPLATPSATIPITVLRLVMADPAASHVATVSRSLATNACASRRTMSAMDNAQARGAVRRPERRGRRPGKEAGSAI